MKLCTDVAWLCWIEAHPGTAGWIQAVFSIIAIVVAFLAPWVLDASKEAIRQKRLRRVTIDAMGMASAAVTVIADTAENAEMRELFGTEADAFPHASFDIARTAIDTMPLVEIDDVALVRLAQSFTVKFVGALSEINHFKDFADDDEDGRQWAAMVRQRDQELASIYDQAAVFR